MTISTIRSQIVADSSSRKKVLVIDTALLDGAVFLDKRHSSLKCSSPLGVDNRLHRMARLAAILPVEATSVRSAGCSTLRHC